MRHASDTEIYIALKPTRARRRRQQVAGLETNSLLGLKPTIGEIQYAPNLAESFIQFGDRVRVLSDLATEERGLAGKVGEVYGQTTPSSTNPTTIGTPLKDYAVSVFFDDTREQHWFPEHLVELVDHNPGATLRLGDTEYVRNADGSWAERKTKPNV